ncbi:MAG: 2-amino-4-hydroxy-6-hydroxymethyldihydropteridine diphosphokinase [Deltaproteobacteria bacterium]|nr:MAG: 2-amino-4-hydroxy-6-hydroxymethyldihydropteridine diphosphokinase [Deltaproteobacteria bacterium]
MPEACIALGGNLGPVLHTFCRALRRMTAFCEPLALSAAYHTTALVQPGMVAPPYWNAVVVVHCRLVPRALLGRLLALETRAGRRRSRRWAARPLDLDLLLYDGCTMHTRQLTLPHPRLRQRSFVLLPLCDVRPQLAVGPDGLTAQASLQRLPAASAGILARRTNWYAPGRLC